MLLSKTVLKYKHALVLFFLCVQTMLTIKLPFSITENFYTNTFVQSSSSIISWSNQGTTRDKSVRCGWTQWCSSVIQNSFRQTPNLFSKGSKSTSAHHGRAHTIYKIFVVFYYYYYYFCWAVLSWFHVNVMVRVNPPSLFFILLYTSIIVNIICTSFLQAPSW